MVSLTAWRTLRQQLKSSIASPALFVAGSGLRLSPRTVQARLRSLAIRAGLPTHVHPHMMRHSFASHVLQSSHDLRAVQEMLGHASIASTQIYTALDFQHLAQAYDLAHPRAKAGQGK
jgi:integrase/recombinase XerC